MASSAPIVTKQQYIELLRMEASDKHIKRKIDHLMTVKKLFQISYAAILPFLFFIGLCVCSILVPMHLSGFQSAILPMWYTPFMMLSLPCYLLTVISLFLDPFLLSYIKRRYYSSLGTQSVYVGDIDFVKSVNLFVWSFSWIPLSIVCVVLKVHTLYDFVNYRMTFSPVFFTCVVLILAPPIIWLYKFNRGRLVSLTENRSVFTVYIWSTIVNIFIVIQFGLISGKLDGTIPATWGGVFTPMWLLFIVVILLCPVTCIITVTSNSEFFAGLSVGSCVMCSCVIPLLTFMILLSLKLDQSIAIQWGVLFMPLYIFELFITLFAALLMVNVFREGIPVA